MSYSFIAYILFCIAFGLTVVVTLFRMDRMISALSALVLLSLVFAFYGIRWFDSSKPGYMSDSWPPVINACPDYLVYYKNTNTNEETCVDLIGVNRSNGTLKPWPKDKTPENPPAGNEFYFKKVYKPTLTAEQKRDLCNSAMSLGLSWEGITNGESCTYK